MGYAIRYAPHGWQEKPGWYDWRFQTMTAAMLLVALILMRGWPMGREMMERWLTVGNGGGLEHALGAMSDCIAGGKGWYEGAVVFGRTILGG